MEIAASARKHGVSDHDMMHAARHHWRQFGTADPAVTIRVGPSTTGAPLEIGLVDDEAGSAIIHAMPARRKYLRDWWIR